MYLEDNLHKSDARKIPISTVIDTHYRKILFQINRRHVKIIVCDLKFIIFIRICVFAKASVNQIKGKIKFRMERVRIFLFTEFLIPWTFFLWNYSSGRRWGEARLIFSTDRIYGLFNSGETRITFNPSRTLSIYLSEKTNK